MRLFLEFSIVHGLNWKTLKVCSGRCCDVGKRCGDVWTSRPCDENSHSLDSSHTAKNTAQDCLQLIPTWPQVVWSRKINWRFLHFQTFHIFLHFCKEFFKLIKEVNSAAVTKDEAGRQTHQRTAKVRTDHRAAAALNALRKWNVHEMQQMNVWGQREVILNAHH